jgi:hypothetical protein
MTDTQGYGQHGSSLRDLPRLRSSRRLRSSSWDRSGGNDDRVTLAPGAVATLAEIEGAGSICHIWITVASEHMTVQPRTREPDLLRRLLLRMYWDGEEQPSVLVPLGDFFGCGHGRTANFVSAPLQMSPQDGKGLNCFFHMPFATGARIEVASEMAEESVYLYLVRRRRRHDLHRRRRLAAVASRHRNRGLFQHGLVPRPALQRALPRHHAARRRQLVR